MAVQLSLETAEGHITHHLYLELKKYPLEMKCLYGYLELFDNVDKTKIHTCFRSLAFTTAQLTM